VNLKDEFVRYRLGGAGKWNTLKVMLKIHHSLETLASTVTDGISLLLCAMQGYYDQFE
jgi:hypothetical protein